jgi:precorrin-6B methylase 2
MAAGIGGVKTADWAELWRQLVEDSERHHRRFPDPGRSERYLRRLQAGPKALAGDDPLVDLVAQQLTPDSTVLDIGAAAGRWSLRLARAAKRVTAVEPSAQLRRSLEEHAWQLGIDNLTVLAATWPECSAPSHDVVLNSHAMYGTADLPALVRSMEDHAHKRCIVVMRLIDPRGAMAELSSELRGHPHDSANFTIGYNVLLGMGRCPNVVMDSVVKHWRDADLDSAVARARRHLYLAPTDSSHDGSIRRVLSGRLERTGQGLRWPDRSRSALVWWDPPAG